MHLVEKNTIVLFNLCKIDKKVAFNSILYIVYT